MRTTSPTTASILVSLAAACWASTVGGCRSAQGTAARHEADAPLTETEWTCAAIAGHAMPEGAAPTLQLSLPDRANGFAGVNRYFGSSEFDRSAMRFSKLGATRMAGPPERMDLESAFLAMLERSRTFRLKGTTLTLLGEDGQELGSFTCASR